MLLLKKQKNYQVVVNLQDLGGVSDSEAAAEQIQKTQSVESVGTVITETTARAEKILPKLHQKNNMNLL